MSKIESFSSEISKIDNLIFKTRVELDNFSTMRLKAKSNLLLVKSVEALSKALPILNKYKINYRVLGWGANQILKTSENLVYLKLDLPFNKSIFSSKKEIYELPASVSLPVLVKHAADFGLKGFECLAGIPASIGGAIAMNAGTNAGEIAPFVKEVKIMTTAGEIRNYVVQEKSFSYRSNNFLQPGEVLFCAKIQSLGEDDEVSKKVRDYLEYRSQSQPLKEKTCGCVFKNYSSEIRAGKYIDLLGLKGFSFNGIKISKKHGNFMENFANASYEDFEKFLKIVRDELLLQYGVTFELEVKL